MARLNRRDIIKGAGIGAGLALVPSAVKALSIPDVDRAPDIFRNRCAILVWPSLSQMYFKYIDNDGLLHKQCIPYESKTYGLYELSTNIANGIRNLVDYFKQSNDYTVEIKYDYDYKSPRAYNLCHRSAIRSGISSGIRAYYQRGYNKFANLIVVTAQKNNDELWNIWHDSIYTSTYNLTYNGKEIFFHKGEQLANS